jgi:hypothetical protein
MKINLETKGKADISQDELFPALLKFLKDEAQLKKAIDSILQSKQPGVESTDITEIKGKDGKLTFQIDFTSHPTKEGGKYYKAVKDIDAKRQPVGFKKRNAGFYKKLSEFLEDKKKKRFKTVSFEEAAEEMKFLFPNLTDRTLTIYFSDKRRQQMKGFTYDGVEKKFFL